MAVIRHKFNAKPQVIDNIRFSSKKEARYYESLKQRKANGEVLFFLRQAPFHIINGNTRYVIDFVEFLNDGTVKFVDVKGVKTDVYELKRKIVESEYPIEITEA
jgi:hypothetical protein